MVVATPWTGLEAAALRQARRMSIRAYAAHLGVSAATVANWNSRGMNARLNTETQQLLDIDLERASQAVRERFSSALAERLRGEVKESAADDPVDHSTVSTNEIDRAYPDSSQSAGGEVVRRQIPAIRCVLDAHDIPQDGPVRPESLLRDDVAALVQMRLQSQYGRLTIRLPQLLPELHRALESTVGQRRAMVSGLLVQAYRAADAVADKFGFYDLSARIIGLMKDAARESGDERAIAAAAYVRAETFFANGQYEVGRRTLERAAQRLMPEAGIGSAAAYGSLHMRAAVLAARAGTLSKANDHLLEASSWAHGLPDGVYAGTVFGPASVRIHEVALAVDGGDPDTALSVAEQWQPHADLPAERRSHFYIDVARAFAMVESPAQTRDALWTARTIAPEHVHDHPQVRETLDGLTRGRLSHDARVRQLRQWIGEAVSAS